MDSRKNLIAGLVALVSITLVSGCSTTKVVATPPQLIKPPSILLEECSITPLVRLETNKDLLSAYQALYLDFQECNSTKRALKEWYTKMEAKIYPE